MIHIELLPGQSVAVKTGATYHVDLWSEYVEFLSIVELDVELLLVVEQIVAGERVFGEDED
jgi:hypothetical protein